MKNNKEHSNFTDTKNSKRKLRLAGAAAAITLSSIAGGLLASNSDQNSNAEVKTEQTTTTQKQSEKFTGTSAEATKQLMPSAQYLALSLASDRSGRVEQAGILSNDPGSSSILYNYTVEGGDHKKLVVEVTAQQDPSDPLKFKPETVEAYSFTVSDLNKQIDSTLDNPEDDVIEKRLTINPTAGEFTIQTTNSEGQPVIVKSIGNPADSFDQANTMFGEFTAITGTK